MEEQARFVEMGANLLIHKADVIFFRQGMMKEMGELRERLNLKSRDASEGGVTI